MTEAESTPEKKSSLEEKNKTKIKFITKASFYRLGILFLLILLVIWIGGCMAMSMPGTSYQGELSPMTDDEEAIAKEMKADIVHLSEEIGPRSLENYENLLKATEFIAESFEKAGYQVKRHTYQPDPGVLSRAWNETNYQEHIYTNLEVELKGTELPDEIIVFGAHYDSVALPGGCPAANDNGSGVAAVLALARRFAGNPQKRTLRFLAFVNEEPPFFWTKAMGSYVYAMDCKKNGDQINAMLSAETIGYYTDQPKSQSYPPPLSFFYPSTGNFVAFVGNFSSRSLVKECVRIFRKETKFPSEGAALPGLIPGVGWSDHWAFWKAGYPALMVTDTAPFRYPFYHTGMDTSDKINYEKMARVVKGLEGVIKTLSSK